MSSSRKNISSVVLLHGYAETPDKVWFPWIHRRLEERQARVWAPHLPSPLKPELSAWLKAVMLQARLWKSDTIVVGHSLGGILALRVLASCPEVKVGAVITVSSPFAAMVPVRQLVDAFSRPIDWARLRRQAGAFIVIHSKNDQLVPFDHALRYGESLGAKVVLTEKDGHFIGRTAPAVWREVDRLLGGIL
jgi:hypothetical protein